MIYHVCVCLAAIICDTAYLDRLPDMFTYTDWHPFKRRTVALVQLSPGVIEPVIWPTASERR